MKTWRVRKLAFRAAKLVLENPKARAKIASTARRVWNHPAVRAKSSALARRLKGKSGDSPDKNQTTKIVSWNIGKRDAAWLELAQMSVDLALLQEVGSVDGIPDSIHIDPNHPPEITTYDRWPTIARLSDKLSVEWLKPISPPDYSRVGKGEVVVSDRSTVAFARILPSTGQPFIVASLYARWIKPRPETKSSWGVGYQDASLHRAISDLSAFIGSTNPSKHRILLAGDFNIILGDTDPSLSLPKRDRTVFDRLGALGLEFVGPRRNPSSPIKSEQKGDPENTPTFYTSRQNPASADRQLDYVFASRGFHNQINVTALNSPEEWGPSDHCRLLMEVGI